MFKQYHPNVRALAQFLKFLKVKVSIESINEALQNHPDWPSLLSITDSLNQWNVPNGVGMMEPNEIDQVPVPFLVYLPEEPPLGIVTEVNTEKIKLSTKNYKKTETLSRAEFLKRWNGIYLLAEPNEHSGESTYGWKKMRGFLSSWLLFGIPAVLAVLAIFLIKPFAEGETIALYPTSAVIIQYFIMLTGVFVTSLLLWYEIDTDNPLLQKVCAGIKQGNCSAILKSRGAKLFSWLSWSEVGFFYFAGGTLTLLFIKDGILAVAAANLVALPYVLYSIYYQRWVVKHWCILCLLVQLLLILGGINIVGNRMLSALGNISMPIILYACLMYIAAMYLWTEAKPFLVSKEHAKHMKREFLRLKFNSELFMTLLNKQKLIAGSMEGMGIDLGNPSATNEIIKVCNPYCGACIKTHAKIEQLLENTPNLKVKIIFRTSHTTLEDPSVNLVKHFLAIAAENDTRKLKQALDSWYLSDKQDYDLFRRQYHINGQLEKQTPRWEEMNKWCRATGITFTPTFFVNGRQLPDVYNIEDMQYFLLE